ncbi:MAG: oligosaccharide flippase family protein [Acidobacteriota bacterium]
MSLIDLRAFRKSSLIILTGTMLGQAVGYIYTVFAANLAGPLSFGYYSLALSAVALLVGALNLGLNRTVVRFVAIYHSAQNREKLKGTIWFVGSFLLSLGVLFGVAASYAAEPIAQFYFGTGSMRNLVTFCAWIIPICMMMNFGFDVLRGIGCAEYRTYFENILQKVLRLPILFAGFGPDALTTLIGAELASYGAALVLTMKQIHRRFGSVLSQAGASIPAKDILSFSLPLVPASILTAFGGQSEVLILGWLGFVLEAGALSIAVRSTSFGSVILAAFNSNLAPLISQLSEERRVDELRAVFRRTTIWQLRMILGWSGLLIVLSTDLLSLFGPAYPACTNALVILSLKQVADTILGPVGLVITMSGFAGLSLLNNLLYFVLSIVLDVVLIPPLGVTGAAISILVTTVALNGIVSWQVWKVFRIHALSRETVALVVCFVGALLLSFITKKFFYFDSSRMVRVCLTCFLYSTVYVACIGCIRLWRYGGRRNRPVFS